MSPGQGSDRASFLEARSEWDNCFGNLAKGKFNWQLAAAAFALIAIGMSAAFVHVSTTAKVVPYVIQVDRAGQVVHVAAADELTTPDQEWVRTELAEWVREIRTVLPHQAWRFQAEMVRRAWTKTTPASATYLNQQFEQPTQDPRRLSRRIQREVRVLSVLRVPGTPTWRLRWRELEIPIMAGGQPKETEWEGTVTVALVPPKTVRAAADNPFGIRLTSIHWVDVADITPRTE